MEKSKQSSSTARHFTGIIIIFFLIASVWRRVSLSLSLSLQRSAVAQLVCRISSIDRSEFHFPFIFLSFFAWFARAPLALLIKPHFIYFPFLAVRFLFSLSGNCRCAALCARLAARNNHSTLRWFLRCWNKNPSIFNMQIYFIRWLTPAAASHQRSRWRFFIFFHFIHAKHADRSRSMCPSLWVTKISFLCEQRHLWVENILVFFFVILFAAARRQPTVRRRAAQIEKNKFKQRKRKQRTHTLAHSLTHWKGDAGRWYEMAMRQERCDWSGGGVLRVRTRRRMKINGHN